MTILVRDNLIDIDNLVYILSFVQNIDELEKIYVDLGISMNKQVLKVIKAVKKSDKIDKKKLDFYFKEYKFSEGRFYIGSCFYRGYYFDKVNNIENYIKCIMETSEREQLKYIFKRVLSFKYEGEFLDNILKKALDDKNEFLKQLVDINIPNELKWKLCTITIDYRRCVNEYIGLLNECNRLFGEGLNNLKELSLEWYEELKVKVQEDGLKIIETEFGSLDLNKYSEVHVYPRVVDSAALDCREGHDTIHLFLGIDIYEAIKILGRGNKSNWAMNALKMISEPNRFKILEMLGKNEMFSGEIAESLNLTNATITHHTMALTFANLIEWESRGNKTYYRTNKKSIDSLCDVLEEEFDL